MQPEEIVKQYSLIQLSEQAERLAKDRFVIDADRFHDKAACLEEIYKALGFSEYTPHANYDGLADLLTSQAWAEPVMSIDVINTQQLKSVDKDVILSIFSIFHDAIVDWSKNDKQLTVRLIKDA